MCIFRPSSVSITHLQVVEFIRAVENVIRMSHFLACQPHHLQYSLVPFFFGSFATLNNTKWNCPYFFIVKYDCCQPGSLCKLWHCTCRLGLSPHSKTVPGLPMPFFVEFARLPCSCLGLLPAQDVQGRTCKATKIGHLCCDGSGLVIVCGPVFVSCCPGLHKQLLLSFLTEGWHPVKNQSRKTTCVVVISNFSCMLAHNYYYFCYSPFFSNWYFSKFH